MIPYCRMRQSAASQSPHLASLGGGGSSQYCKITYVLFPTAIAAIVWWKAHPSFLQDQPLVCISHKTVQLTDLSHSTIAILLTSIASVAGCRLLASKLRLIAYNNHTFKDVEDPGTQELGQGTLGTRHSLIRAFLFILRVDRVLLFNRPQASASRAVMYVARSMNFRRRFTLA